MSRYMYESNETVKWADETLDTVAYRPDQVRLLAQVLD